MPIPLSNEVLIFLIYYHRITRVGNKNTWVYEKCIRQGMAVTYVSKTAAWPRQVEGKQYIYSY